MKRLFSPVRVANGLLILILVGAVLAGCTTPSPAATEQAAASPAAPTGAAAQSPTAEASPAASHTPASPAEPTSTPEPPTPTVAAPSPTPSPEPSATQATAAEGPSTLPLGASLNSYRTQVVVRMNDAEGPISEQWESSVVMDPLAFHQVITGEGTLEMLYVEGTFWTYMEPLGWRATVLTAEEAEGLSGMAASEPSMTLDPAVQLDTSITWLPAQYRLSLVEGSYSAVGKETIEGVACQHYTVDSTYPYKVTIQQPVVMSAEVTIRTQGDLWIADQSGWDPILMKAEVIEVTTTTTSAGTVEETEHVDMRVYDVGEPMEIVPPQ